MMSTAGVGAMRFTSVDQEVFVLFFYFYLLLF